MNDFSTIVTGDVIQVLKKQSPEFLYDIVIADPPYNIGKDFGNNRDSMAIDEYVSWCKEWIQDCFRLLADDGLIYIYGFAEIIARVAVEYPINEQKWLVWHYINKVAPASQFWQRAHETILCLWKPGMKCPPLELSQIKEPYTDKYLALMGKERSAAKGRFSKGDTKTIFANNNGTLPRDVIHIPALAGGAGNRERWFYCRTCGGEVRPPAEIEQHNTHDTLKHPTQKPMELTKKLILSKIKGKAGRVLIPFAGSGAECIVAKAMGIEFKGIEINPEYVKFANSWLKESVRDKTINSLPVEPTINYLFD